ncbi:hypothetical protein [uncultured Croceitalea sp.]|uniref:hypothetical protein n=1 Tax=uncultured Croceitalea sp. TaxID=1798908 RepID=UPI00374F4470
MKKIIYSLILFLTLGLTMGYACDLCKKNQPKVLENITHGTGPTGTIDYIITWSAIIIVGFTLFYSVKYLVNPKEDNPNHIKNSILKRDF